MFQGQLLAIHLAPTATAELQKVEQAQAIAGQGIEGDRYSIGKGTFSKPGSKSQEITLIEQEAVEAAAREDEIPLEFVHTRRNLLTCGVPLNHLVGKEFTVGSVTMRGVKLCEPCGHLEKLHFSGIKHALQHRGGLRAQIISGGVLQVGDVIKPMEG